MSRRLVILIAAACFGCVACEEKIELKMPGADWKMKQNAGAEGKRPIYVVNDKVGAEIVIAALDPDEEKKSVGVLLAGAAALLTSRGAEVGEPVFSPDGRSGRLSFRAAAGSGQVSGLVAVIRPLGGKGKTLAVIGRWPAKADEAMTGDCLVLLGSIRLK